MDPEDIVALLSEWTPVAHNVSHDYLCVRKLCGPYADKIPPPDRWIDTCEPLRSSHFPDLISNPTECSLESLVGKLSVLPQITTPHQSVRGRRDVRGGCTGRFVVCSPIGYPTPSRACWPRRRAVRGLVHHAIDRAHRAAVEAKRPLDHCIQKYGKEAVVDIVRALIDAVSGLPPYSAATRAAIVKTLRYLLDSLESAVYNGTYG
ncbi:MAG: hypothetical protein KatS3mg082_1457 [Nitrospiraceae bacterium]|nr:MAG: hypothetical protein KatS3mg082_1457 [Nitrospiraceae bacterium]